MNGEFHDAFRTVQDGQVKTLLSRTKAEEKDAFHWKDPLRDFETMGQFVSAELRYWTQQSVGTRLEYLKSFGEEHYRNERKPLEDPIDFLRRMTIAWRDCAYILGEELKCWLRPEMQGRGSKEVIEKVLQLVIVAAEQPRKHLARKAG